MESNNIASKLRQGGLPKHMALARLLLFSVRSITDTVGSLSDPSLLSSALIQGAIALACAAYLFFGVIAPHAKKKRMDDTGSHTKAWPKKRRKAIFCDTFPS